MRVKNNKGAALVEYVVLVGLIGVIAIVGVNSLGQQVSGTFTLVSETTRIADNTGSGSEEATPGGSTPPVVGGGTGPALPDPSSCVIFTAGSGAIDGDADHPGVFCFQYEDAVQGNGPDAVLVDTPDDYVFVSGTGGMSFDSGSGDDVAFYNQGECARSFPNMGTGNNEVVFLNHASTDAYFSEDPFFGGFFIDFADGSGIVPAGNITQYHFTDTVVSAAEATARASSDPIAPSNPVCGGPGPGGPGGFPENNG